MRARRSVGNSDFRSLHGAVLAPPEATTTPALVAELKELWVAALAGEGTSAAHHHQSAG